MSRISSQFGDQQAYEDAQRRRFARRHEPGYTGEGFNYKQYPYMVSAAALGTNQIMNVNSRYQDTTSNYKKKAGFPVSNGLGQGGTAAYATGMGGGGMP